MISANGVSTPRKSAETTDSTMATMIQMAKAEQFQTPATSISAGHTSRMITVSSVPIT